MDNIFEIKSIMRKRTYGFLIDLFLILMIQKSITFTFNNFFNTFFYHLPNEIQAQLIKGIDSSNLLILLIVFWGYFILSYYLGNGQTPGKMIVGLKIQSDTNELSLSQCTMRTLGYFICYVTCCILFIIPFLTKNQNGIPDWISNTKVIDENSRSPDEELQQELFHLNDDNNKSA